jgi:electron transfer flavoprotein beta subunit
MKILVLLRMSPDPDGALELKADGSGLDREWMDLKLNEFDDHALEEAVLLKEATAGSVIAVAVGDGAQRTLQMASRAARHPQSLSNGRKRR